MKRTLTLALTLAFLMCSCYHLGTVGPAKKVCVAEIENRTEEATLAATLRQCLNEQLGTGVGTTPSSKPCSYDLHTKITKITNRSMARAEIREKKSRDDDSDVYQTVLYALEITVQYELEPKLQGLKQLAGTVVGRASLPRMHDRNVALQDALKQASLDISRQLAAIVRDAP
ncbi:MAG: hypothetical protein IKP00_08780 [Victivallales bacterium]|nr:hypothetical protein [Victivallales bacterium]